MTSPSPWSVPTTGLSLVIKLHKIMREQGVSQNQISKRAGIAPSALGNWRAGKRGPTLFAIEACFNAIGYDIVAVKREEG